MAGVRWRVILWMAACATAMLPAGVAAQAPGVDVRLGGRMQVQWNSTSVDETAAGEPLPSSTFETRRVRLTADVSIGDWITGVIEPEFALGELSLKSAWMALELDPALVLRAGQMKKPFGLVTLTSSTTFPVIERGLHIRGLGDAVDHQRLIEELGYEGYDIGAAIEGSHGPLAWSGGVFNGTGPDTRDENDGKSIAARASWQGSAGVPLKVGAAWSRRELSDGADGSRVGDAFGVDIELGGFRRGPWLLAEATVGDNLVSTEHYVGAQAVGAWFFETGGARVEGVEPAMRVSWGDPDRTVSSDGGVLVTPGVNIYFFGRNRLMLNWDLYMPQLDEVGTQHAMRAQMNLHF